MRNRLSIAALVLLSCGDDPADCSLPPGRYAVHAFDPSGANPDRDFVQLNEAESSCHVTDGGAINGAVLDLDCGKVSGGQYYCSGEAYSAAVRYEVNMRGPL